MGQSVPFWLRGDRLLSLSQSEYVLCLSWGEREFLKQSSSGTGNFSGKMKVDLCLLDICLPLGADLCGLTDTLLILGSQFLLGLPEGTTACSDLTFVRCIFSFNIYICLAASHAFKVRAMEQRGTEVGGRGHRFGSCFWLVSLQQNCSLMIWESLNADVWGMTSLL